MTISFRPASPATAEKILDAVRAELRRLLAAGRPFESANHIGAGWTSRRPLTRNL